MWGCGIKIGKRGREARSERCSRMGKTARRSLCPSSSRNSCSCPCLPLLSEFLVPTSLSLEAWWPLQPRSQCGAESLCPVLPLHLIAWSLLLCGFRLAWWNAEMGLWVRGMSSQMFLFYRWKDREPGWIKAVCWRVAELDQCRVGLSASPPLCYWRSHESRQEIPHSSMIISGREPLGFDAQIPASKRVTEG